MSDEDKNLAQRFLRFLEARLRAGSITPESPMTSTGIIEEAAKSGIKLTERKIQELVRYLRTDPSQGHLIGSSSGAVMGYSLCRTPAEFMKMNAHLRTRAINDFAAWSIPLKKYESDRTIDMELDHPVVQQLMSEFECVRVQ